MEPKRKPTAMLSAFRQAILSRVGDEKRGTGGILSAT